MSSKYMRKLVESLENSYIEEITETSYDSYGPVSTLKFLEIYLNDYGDKLSAGDVENMLGRIKYALKLENENISIQDGDNDFQMEPEYPF